MSKETNNHVVIMAGGIGSRFWPMSTPEYPKQFIDVMGTGRTLIQMTVDRFRGICEPQHFWVVTAERYVPIVREQLPEIPEAHILAEPEARNTAPCIAYACWKIRQREEEANIVVTPSDALVVDVTEFRRVIGAALDFTQEDGRIVTLGMKPTRPETGYGYIQAAQPIPQTELFKVQAFKEKPDLETARQYVAEGGYYWNAGIFVWNVRTITSELRLHAPQIAAVMDEMAPAFYTEREPETLRRLFPTCEKISIDYAVMEKSRGIHVLPAEFGWSDLGSWGSLHTLLPRDGEGNATVGSHIKLVDCKNCIVHTAEERQVVVEGLDGFIISEKDGRLLICRLENEQHIKEYSALI